MAFGFGPVEKIVVQVYRRELTRGERSNSLQTDFQQGAPGALSREPICLERQATGVGA
jgi:hypothetical protein